MGIADKFFQIKNDKSSANLKAGQDFLEANKQKAGIITLPSGLQYEVLTEGSVIKPLASNKVTCHYHGTLIDRDRVRQFGKARTTGHLSFKYGN